MAKGRDKHQERHHGLSLYGKDLVRRCAAHCELCNSSGRPLEIFEVPPVPVDPDFSHCLMICAECKGQIEKPKRLNADHWRCLNQTMWSEVEAAKVTAIVLLKQLEQTESWAQELLEIAYLSPSEEEWVDAWKLI